MAKYIEEQGSAKQLTERFDRVRLHLVAGKVGLALDLLEKAVEKIRKKTHEKIGWIDWDYYSKWWFQKTKTREENIKFILNKCLERRQLADRIKQIHKTRPVFYTEREKKSLDATKEGEKEGMDAREKRLLEESELFVTPFNKYERYHFDEFEDPEVVMSEARNPEKLTGLLHNEALAETLKRYKSRLPDLMYHLEGNAIVQKVVEHIKDNPGASVEQIHQMSYPLQTLRTFDKFVKTLKRNGVEHNDARRLSAFLLFGGKGRGLAEFALAVHLKGATGRFERKPIEVETAIKPLLLRKETEKRKTEGTEKWVPSKALYPRKGVDKRLDEEFRTFFEEILDLVELCGGEWRLRKTIKPEHVKELKGTRQKEMKDLFKRAFLKFNASRVREKGKLAGIRKEEFDKVMRDINAIKALLSEQHGFKI